MFLTIMTIIQSILLQVSAQISKGFTASEHPSTTTTSGKLLGNGRYGVQVSNAQQGGRSARYIHIS